MVRASDIVQSSPASRIRNPTSLSRPQARTTGSLENAGSMSVATDGGPWSPACDGTAPPVEACAVRQWLRHVRRWSRSYRGVVAILSLQGQGRHDTGIRRPFRQATKSYRIQRPIRQPAGLSRGRGSVRRASVVRGLARHRDEDGERRRHAKNRHPDRPMAQINDGLALESIDSRPKQKSTVLTVNWRRGMHHSLREP